MNGNAADIDDVAAEVDGEVAGVVDLEGGGKLPVTLDAELVEKARDAGVDVDRIKQAAVPASAVSLQGQTDALDDTATIPIQDRRQTDLTSRFRRDREYQFIEDKQIQRLIKQGVSYTERVGHFLLARDDLIPTVKERLAALIMGEDGITPEPADPDSDADQRLADHLEELYRSDVRPNKRIDAILRENMMNARAVLRSTDLMELDLADLDYLRDGITGEEIYVQDRVTVYEFDTANVDSESDSGDALRGIDLDQRTIEPKALVIGEHVFDISLYDKPPLEAVADTAVNKMVLQRLKARKAEIASFGAVYASVEPPTYLPEDRYFDRVDDDDWDGEGEPPTKLERAMTNNLQNAFDTLKDFQSGTVMSVPEFWNLEQLEIPETEDPIDEQIRGYNRDISRRLLVPLDLIELQDGSELSRETMFQTLMTTIAGWRQEIQRVFDEFAEIQAEIEGISGEVNHSFPPLRDANAKLIVNALAHAGVAGLTQREVRQMLNAIQGVDLDTDADSPAPEDGSLPPEGGPESPEDRQQQMRQFLEEQRRGPGDDQDQDGQQAGQQAAGADAAAKVAQTLQASTHQAQRTADDRPDDVSFQIDFPVSQRPNVPSRISVESIDHAVGGRLALPKIPKRDMDADELRRRVDDMMFDIVDSHEALSALETRIADRPPDHQPFIDISGQVPVDAVERLSRDLPDQFMQLLDALEADQAGQAGDSGNWKPAAGVDGDQAGGAGRNRAADILRNVPFLPSPSDDGPTTITENQLKDWLLWVRAGRPDLQADWNPALHPRGPDGRFVERPYDVPDDAIDDIRDMDPPEVLDNLAAAGELSDDDVSALLEDPQIRIDGVPDDASSRSDLQDAGDSDGADGPDWAADMAYASPDPGQDLRPDSADSVQPLLSDDEGQAGAAASNMDVARWDDGQVAFVKRHREDQDGARADGEKPTLAERAIAADQFLRNLGFDDQVPDIAVSDPQGGYMSSRKIDGEHLRGSTPAGADAVDEDEFRRFSAAVLLAGNSDLHGDNVVVQEDGSFAAIDLNKSGGDFTSASKFRSRGVNELVTNAQKLGMDFSRSDLQDAAEELAQDIDIDDALAGVEDSAIGDAPRHQFRENLRANIEAFRAGEVQI